MFASLTLAAALTMSTIQERNVQCVFLKTGVEQPELADDEMNKLQQDHLTFLEGLWESRKALLIGPFGTSKPDTAMRGLVVVDTESSESALAALNQDPWIMSGVMVLEPHTLVVDTAKIGKGPEFLDLEKHWMVLFARKSGETFATEEQVAAMDKGHEAAIASFVTKGTMRAYWQFANDDSFYSVLFCGGEREAVDATLASDPLVQAGLLQPKIYDWFTAKGAFKQ